AKGIVAGVGCAPRLTLRAKRPGHAADLVFARLNTEAHKIKRVSEGTHLVKRNWLEVSGLNIDVVPNGIVESPRWSASGSAGQHRQVRPEPDIQGITQLASDASDKAGLQCRRIQRSEFSAIRCFRHFRQSPLSRP